MIRDDLSVSRSTFESSGLEAEQFEYRYSKNGVPEAEKSQKRGERGLS